MSARQHSHREVRPTLNRLKNNQVYLFVDQNHREELVDYFQSLRMKGILCDVTLRQGSRNFTCHRNILGAGSPYFRALFIDSESGKFIKNVELTEDIDPEAMNEVLGYLYGGKVYLTPENSVDIFKAAYSFKLETLMKESMFALAKFLSPENCLLVREMALMYGQKQLQEWSWRFICQNFTQVAMTQQFIELAEEKVEEILQSDDIHTNNEKQVFDSLVRWIDFKRRERGVHFAKLLRLIRLPLLDKETLMNHVEKEQLVRRSPTAKEMLMEAMRFNMADEKLKITLRSPRTIPRKCSKMLEVIMFVGGRGRSPGESRVTMCYEPVKDKWYTLSPVPAILYDHSATAVDGIVYVCGGSVEGKASLLLQDDVLMFDPHLNHWSKLAPMTEARAQLATGGNQGLLYAIGGMIDGYQWNAAEVYNPISNRWSFIPTPNIPRSNHAMVTTATHLYVIGGEGHEIEPVISVERYDPAVDAWSFVLPMSCGRVGACAVVCDEKLYVIGGWNGYHTMKQCEVYDMETHQWTAIEDTNEFRQNAEAVVAQESIYVIGGRDFHGKKYESIERYNALSKHWEVVSQLPLPKTGYRCVKIRIWEDHLVPMRTTKY